MKSDLDNIYIFKTNITQLNANCTVSKTLSDHIAILKWSIDTEDVDCVLRIVSDSLTTETIINVINGLGYECQELN